MPWGVSTNPCLEQCLMLSQFAFLRDLLKIAFKGRYSLIGPVRSVTACEGTGRRRTGDCRERTRGVDMWDRLASVLVREGGNGNVAAIKEVGDRLDGKPAQAVAITGDPDSPVIFNLRLGDGLKTIEHEPAPEALIAPLVAIAAQGDEG